MKYIIPNDLKPWQREVVEREQRFNDGCCLFHTMGAGKTRTAVELLKKFNAKRILLVSLEKVSKDVWPNELNKWKYPIKHEYIGGLSAAKQETRLRGGVMEGTMIATTFSAFSHSTAVKNRPKRVDLPNSPLLQAYINIPWDIIIIDESTKIKDPTSKVSLAMLNLAVNCPNAYILQMTGTPNPEAILDLYTQISMVDRGKRFGQSFVKWRDTYFYQRAYSYDYLPFAFTAETVAKLTNDIIYALTKTDLDKESVVPKRIENDVLFQLSERSMAQYKEMKQYVLDINPNQSIIASNAAVMLSKLAQISSGIVYANDGAHNFVGTDKVQALMGLIKKIPGKIIVCYWFQASRTLIERWLKVNGIDFAHASEISETDFTKSGELKVLLLQPAMGAYGSNYQEDCHNLIWYDVDMSGERFQQTEARIDRQGQAKPPTFWYLLAEKTYDKKSRDKVRRKEATAVELLKMIQNEKED